MVNMCEELRRYHFWVICRTCGKKYQQRKDMIERQQKRIGKTLCINCYGKEPSFREKRKQIMLTNNHFKGKKHSEESKRKMSERTIG